MQKSNSRSTRTHRVLLGIICLGIVLRLISALLQGDQVAPLPGIFDQISYHGLAQRVLSGHGFSFAEDAWPATRAGEPTAHWSYLYTLYLTGVYALAGIHPLVARIIQAILTGALHCLFVWRISKRVFNERVALFSVGVSALYIYFFYYAGALMTEPFYIVGILWTIDTALRLAEKSTTAIPLRWWHWVEFGLAIGLTILLRQMFILFLPFLFGWLWWSWAKSNSERPESSAPGLPEQQSSQRPLLTGLILTSLVVVLLILPWTLRNYLAFGSFVPLNTNAGFAFFWGNHPIYGTVFPGILPPDGPSYYELIPPELRSLNEAELDQALLKRGIGFVIEDPGRIALLSLSRVREYFKFWPSAESSTLSNIARVASFGLALPFIVSGLWLAFTSVWKTVSGGQRRGAILLVLFTGVYSLIHLLTWALIRYRLPVDAVLLIFAGLSAERAATWLFGKIDRQRNHTSTGHVVLG